MGTDAQGATAIKCAKKKNSDKKAKKQKPEKQTKNTLEAFLKDNWTIKSTQIDSVTHSPIDERDARPER